MLGQAAARWWNALPELSVSCFVCLGQSWGFPVLLDCSHKLLWFQLLMKCGFCAAAHLPTETLTVPVGHCMASALGFLSRYWRFRGSCPGDFSCSQPQLCAQGPCVKCGCSREAPSGFVCSPSPPQVMYLLAKPRVTAALECEWPLAQLTGPIAFDLRSPHLSSKFMSSTHSLEVVQVLNQAF